MKVLFLHGWHSVPGGVKPTYLKNAGHEVINPALDDDDFDVAVCTAQAEYDQHKPDVIVGSSRGGAIAMNIESKDTPLVLLRPAWKNWGTVKRLKPNSLILHSRQDDVIPFTDSVELVSNCELMPETLIEVGQDHRLADLAHVVERLPAFPPLWHLRSGTYTVVRVPSPHNSVVPRAYLAQAASGSTRCQTQLRISQVSQL